MQSEPEKIEAANEWAQATAGDSFLRLCIIAILLLPWGMAFASDAPAPTHRQARVKDVASIEGIRDNQLVGYGIVVGLQGTGDSQQTTFPAQTLAATLLRMGVSVPATAIRVQNLAAVFVAATLPPFARPGTKLDITVSSAGDARSLEGGLLLMTPLYGADGKIYAQAQGPLVVGGYSITSTETSSSPITPTPPAFPSARWSNAASLSISMAGTTSPSCSTTPTSAAPKPWRRPSITNSAVPPPTFSTAAASISPWRRAKTSPNFWPASSQSKSPSIPGEVVVNERTGTVVIGGTVVLQPVPILHGGLAVNVVSDFQVSQPGPFSSGTTQVTQQTRINAIDKPVNRIELKQGATVDDLVRSLQTIGATARDVISILQAMKSAGALEAEIEVL